MFSLLGKLLKIFFWVGTVGLLIALGINEAAARGLLKPNPLAHTPLAQTTWQNGLWQLTHLARFWQQNGPLETAWQEVGPQIGVLKDRGLETAGIAQTFVKTQIISAQPAGSAGGSSGATGAVLGSNSSAGANGQSAPSPTLAPLEQRALEYGRYVYCQAAVKDYERQHPDVKAK